MSEPIVQFSSGQELSSSLIDSSDSSQEKKEIINKLQNKVTNLLVIRKNNEKLVKNQDNLKKCLERLDQYKKLNLELQQKNNLFCDAIGISYNSDLEVIKKSAQELKSKSQLLNSIQNELNIPQNYSIDQSDNILNSIQKLKDKNSENNRFILKILRMLGIFTNYSSFDSDQNNEKPTSLLFEEVQRIKEELEKLKASVENFTYQQNEICQILDIDRSSENDSYTLHFKIKGAIKNMKNSLRDESSEFDIINSQNCQKKVDTPQIVKTTISDLQNSTYKIKKDLYETEQKLKQTTNQLLNFEKKNENIYKKFNCSSIEEVSQNYEEILKIMNASNPDILRRSIHQLKDNNKILQTQTNELNSKIQALQINNQTLNDQLLTFQEQLNCLKSQLNESEAKKIAYKDELKELKSKTNSIKLEIKSLSIERNSLRGQLTDKDEEIISLKELLQTAKENVEEMESQILTLKQQNRKSQQETNSIRSEFENLQQNHNLLQQQHKVIKDEKQNLESELENCKSQIKNLNVEITVKSDELETIKAKNKNLKQQNQSFQIEIEQLTADKSNLKRKINELNNQIDSSHHEKSQISSQLEIEQKDNQSLKSKIEENRSKISQIESNNSQQKSEIDNLKNQLLNKNNEYQKQTSQLQSRISEYEQNIEEMKIQNDQLKNEVSSTKSENESLQLQINEMKNKIETQRKENSELNEKIFELQKENQINNLNQFDSSSQKSENTEELFESKISQLMDEITILKRENEENNQIIDKLTQNQNSYCKLLGINSNSSASSITDSISDLLYDNKGLYSENQNMKQQLTSISTLLNIGESSNPGSIPNAINSLYDEIQQYENEIDKMNLELSNMKQSNQKMCQILNVMTAESLIDAISSVQATLNQIKQILNVSDDRIIDCIESLHESIQTLCDALNIDPSDSWIDSILSMYEALQDAAELLGITNSNQLSDAIKKVLFEKDHFSDEMKQISEAIKKWKNNSSENTPTIVQSHESILSSLCDEMQTLQPEQLLSEVTDLINQNNQFCDHIESLKSNEEKIFALFGIEPNQIRLNSVDKIKEAVDHYNQEINELKETIKKLQSDYEKTNSLSQQVEEFKKENENLTQKLGELNHENGELNQKLSELSLQNSNLNQKLDELSNENSNLTQKLDEISNENGGLNQKLSELSLKNSDLNQKLGELSNENGGLNQKLSELNLQNSDLNQKLGELSNENGDLSNKVNALQDKVENLSQSNEELKQQNSLIENSALLEKQISDICRQLQINPSNDQKASELIAESIDSLKKAKEEFVSFKWKLNRLLKSKKSENTNGDDEDSNKSSDDLLHEIETLSQLVSDLSRLFNVNSPELLLDAAKKQDSLIRQMSPLFECFKSNSNDDSSAEDEQQKLQQIIQEAKKAKQINDKICGLFNVKESSELPNEIKNIQNQLEEMKAKDEENSKFIDQLYESLEITKDENNNDKELRTQKIQKTIFELKENSKGSQKVISQLSKIFGCELDYVSDFAELICQSMKNIAKTLNINEQNSGLFSKIENEIKEIKEQNESLNKKFNEDKLFVQQFTNELNISNDQSDELVRDVITRFRYNNDQLKKQNDEMKKNRQENDEKIKELNDKISFYKTNNRKLFEKFDLLSRFENENENKDVKNSEESKMNEIFKKIDEFKQIKKDYQKSIKKNKDLTTKIKSIELENINHANQIKISRREVTNIDDALKQMKNHEIQINKLREIVEIPDSQFSAVVDKVLKISDQLSSEISEREKLNQEIKFSNKRIKDFEKNEIEYKKLIDTQENKIDSLTADAEKKDITINNLNSSLNDIFKSIGDENIQSADFAIDIIESQKRKIEEITKELSVLKTAVTVDNAFDKMSTNEKHQLKNIKNKIIEQTDNFNSAIAKLQSQLDNRNQNKEEIVRILKDAEANNFRLLELLDPPLTSINNPHSRIHIGNEYSMNPFVKQNADIFRKRKSSQDSVTKEEYNRTMLNRKIIVTENNLINQKKKIDIAERKFSALNAEQRQRTSNANRAVPISELIAQRIKKEQTTLF